MRMFLGRAFALASVASMTLLLAGCPPTAAYIVDTPEQYDENRLYFLESERSDSSVQRTKLVGNTTKASERIRPGQPYSVVLHSLVAPSYSYDVKAGGDFLIVVDFNDENGRKVENLGVWFQRNVSVNGALNFRNLVVLDSAGFAPEKPPYLRVRVLDVDRLDNEIAKSLLHRLEGLNSIVGTWIANPISPVISAALAIGQALVELNQDDVVMDFTFQFFETSEFRPMTTSLESKATKGILSASGLTPLQPGLWILVGLANGGEQSATVYMHPNHRNDPAFRQDGKAMTHRQYFNALFRKGLVYLSDDDRVTVYADAEHAASDRDPFEFPAPVLAFEIVGEKLVATSLMTDQLRSFVQSVLGGHTPDASQIQDWSKLLARTLYLSAVAESALDKRAAPLAAALKNLKDAPVGGVGRLPFQNAVLAEDSMGILKSEYVLGVGRQKWSSLQQVLYADPEHCNQPYTEADLYESGGARMTPAADKIVARYAELESFIVNALLIEGMAGELEKHPKSDPAQIAKSWFDANHGELADLLLDSETWAEQPDNVKRAFRRAMRVEQLLRRLNS